MGGGKGISPWSGYDRNSPPIPPTTAAPRHILPFQTPPTTPSSSLLARPSSPSRRGPLLRLLRLLLQSHRILRRPARRCCRCRRQPRDTPPPGSGDRHIHRMKLVTESCGPRPGMMMGKIVDFGQEIGPRRAVVGRTGPSPAVLRGGSSLRGCASARELIRERISEELRDLSILSCMINLGRFGIGRWKDVCLLLPDLKMLLCSSSVVIKALNVRSRPPWPYPPLRGPVPSHSHESPPP